MTLHPDVIRTVVHQGQRYNLIFEGSGLSIELTLPGLHWLIDRIWELAQGKAPEIHELEFLFRHLIQLEGYLFIDDVEKAREGIITASPVLCVGKRYYLVQGDGGTLWTQPVQKLLRDWHLLCECIHQKEEAV